MELQRQRVCVRGNNLLNALYHGNGKSIPVAFELVKKPFQYCDIKIRQIKRKSNVTNNEFMREMINARLQNDLKFRFMLMDSWFASKKNFDFIHGQGAPFHCRAQGKPGVASGDASQIPEVQCQFGQVTDSNGANPKQPRFHVDLRRIQAQMPEHHKQAQSTHLKPPMPSFSYSGRLRNINKSIRLNFALIKRIQFFALDNARRLGIELAHP